MRTSQACGCKLCTWRKSFQTGETGWQLITNWYSPPKRAACLQQQFCSCKTWHWWSGIWSGGVSFEQEDCLSGLWPALCRQFQRGTTSLHVFKRSTLSVSLCRPPVPAWHQPLVSFPFHAAWPWSNLLPGRCVTTDRGLHKAHQAGVPRSA
eukprot:1157409-Pelagomonas_calceolata.AAC.3